MNTATATTRTLKIDGMSGDACVKKVSGALKEVRDVTTQSVKVGSATIGSDEAGCAAACAAIGRAGFKAHQDPNPNQAADKAQHPQKSPTEPNGAQHPSTGAPNTPAGSCGTGKAAESAGQCSPSKPAALKG